MKPAQTPTLLTVLATLLAAAASAIGLFANVYRDNAFVTAAWRGNDVVTLFVAVPITLVTLWLARRGSLRARLLWLGGLWYLLYNYVFYLYGAALNRVFLAYVAIVVLALFGLVLGLVELDAPALARRFRRQTPVIPISLFMLSIPLIMGLMVELPMVLQMTLYGVVHPDIAKFETTTAVVPAVDMTLLFPALIVAAVLLWQRRPWGYIMTAVLLFKGATYTLALLVMSGFAYAATGILDPLVSFYAAFCLGGTLALIFLLGNLEEEPR